MITQLCQHYGNSQTLNKSKQTYLSLVDNRHAACVSDCSETLKLTRDQFTDRLNQEETCTFSQVDNILNSLSAYRVLLRTM